MSGYGVDTDALAGVVTDVAASGRALEGLAADVEQQVRDLHDAWTGRAADAHAAAHHEWAQGLAEMRTALAGLRRAAGAAHDHYAGAAAANEALWGQVR